MRLDITLTTRRSRGQRMHSLYRQPRQEIRCHLRNRGCAWGSHGQSMDAIPVPWVSCQSPFPRANCAQVHRTASTRWRQHPGSLPRFWDCKGSVVTKYVPMEGSDITKPSWRGYPRHDALERYERDLIDRLELMGAPNIPGTASPPCFCLA